MLHGQGPSWSTLFAWSRLILVVLLYLALASVHIILLFVLSFELPTQINKLTWPNVIENYKLVKIIVPVV